MSDIPPSSPTSAGPAATLPSGYTAPTSTANSNNQGGLNGVNAQTFLQLLVAQLQYQDPTSPVDSTQFLAQTAAFEEVQELSSLESSVSNLVSAQQAGAATSMLGTNVTGTDANGNPVSGTVTGVQLTSSGPKLTVGNSTIAYSSVTSVTLGSSSPTSTSSANQSSSPNPSSSPTGTSSPNPSSSPTGTSSPNPSSSSSPTSPS